MYALVAIALPLHLKAERKLNGWIVALSVVSVLAMVLVLEGTLYPVPEAPKNWLPYLFWCIWGLGWRCMDGRREGVGVLRFCGSQKADGLR